MPMTVARLAANSSSSPAMAPSRPSTRAMPSPTSEDRADLTDLDARA